MDIRQVEFQFKGARGYIHGTDIFNAMTEVGHPAPTINNIRFTIHDFVRTPVCKIYKSTSKEEIGSVENIHARCQFDVDGVIYRLALVTYSGDTNSGGRYEYDEDRVISLCRMDSNSIFLDRKSPFTFIETIVSMNKYLHQEYFPHAVGKWMFTRIDLDKGCEARDKLALRIKHNMNYRLTKSDILVNGKKVGDLFFSLVKA